MNMQKISSSSRSSETVTGWLMAAPAIILITTFLLIPFFMAFGLSFTNQRLISPNPAEWVGLRNFTRLLTVKSLKLQPLTENGVILTDEEGNARYPSLRDYTRNNSEYSELDGLRELNSWNWGTTKHYLLARDVVFYKALYNTLRFVLFVVPLQGGAALLLALLLNRRVKGVTIFRTIYFMPVVVSMVIVALLWRFIYDGTNGLLNSILGGLTFGGFQAVDWLGDPKTALPSIVAMSAWQGVGFHMVIWLAGLQNIPTTFYEAAHIDGATSWQRFRFITWPGLYHTMVFVLVIITMQAFALFIQIDVMTNGGPLDSTQSLVYQAVQRGYRKQDISGGSAVSVIFFLLVLTVSLVQRYLLREKKS